MLTIFILGRILKSITKAKNGIRNGYPLAQRAAVWCEAVMSNEFIPLKQPLRILFWQ